MLDKSESLKLMQSILVNYNKEILSKLYTSKTNNLEKDNYTEYTPLNDYNPATKKYVDDSAEIVIGSSLDIKDNTKIFVDINTNSTNIIDTSNYQTKNDLNLKTASKNIVAAINETSEQFNTIEHDLINSSYEYAGVVTFIDDDGHGLFNTNLKPIFDSNSIKATLCVSVAECGKDGIMTVEQLKQLENEGYEVASHGSDGRLADMTEDKVIKDLELAQKFVKDNDFKAKDILIYNGGNWNNASGRMVKKNVRKYFKYAFNNFGDNNLFVDNFQIGRVDFNAKTLDELKLFVDECEINKTYLVFMIHSWQDTFDGAKLDSLIKYIKTKNIKILKATDATRLKCNYIDYGDGEIYGGTKIDANGRLIANMQKITSSNLNKSIIEYSYGTTTAIIESYIAPTMPIPSGLKDYSWAGYGGILTTIKESLTSAYQILDLKYSKMLRYTRKWDNSLKAWTEFVPTFSYLHIGAMANADIKKSITNYDKKMITEFTVMQGANIPNSSAGIIQVHRGDDDAYSYMEFTPHNEAKKYKSIWNNGTKTWGEWLLY